MMLAVLPGVLPAIAAGEEGDLPSLDFLEFLGGLVEVEGELLGPGDLLEMPLEAPPVPLETSAEQDWGSWESGASEASEASETRAEGREAVNGPASVPEAPEGGR